VTDHCSGKLGTSARALAGGQGQVLCSLFSAGAVQSTASSRYTCADTFRTTWRLGSRLLWTRIASLPLISLATKSGESVLVQGKEDYRVRSKKGAMDKAVVSEWRCGDLPSFAYAHMLILRCRE